MVAHDAAVVALGEAVKFESDGRDFYVRAAAMVRNPIAKAVFEALAEDESDHARRVREIYEELKDKPGWPGTAAMVSRASGVLNAFEQSAGNLSSEVSPDATADEALAKARDMEKRGLLFYRQRMAKASCPAENEFFRRLVAEEEVHLQAIEKVRAAVGSG